MWGGVLWGVPSGSGAGSFSLISGFASPSASGSPAGLLASGQQRKDTWRAVREVWGARTHSFGQNLVTPDCKGFWEMSSGDLKKKSQNALVHRGPNQHKNTGHWSDSRCLQSLPLPGPLPGGRFLLLSLSKTPGYFMVTKLQTHPKYGPFDHLFICGGHWDSSHSRATMNNSAGTPMGRVSWGPAILLLLGDTREWNSQVIW